jgi:hypothetical protein
MARFVLSWLTYAHHLSLGETVDDVVVAGNRAPKRRHAERLKEGSRTMETDQSRSESFEPRAFYSILMLALTSVWVIILAYLVINADADTLKWTRIEVVAVSVQTIIVGALGLLLGINLQHRAIVDARDKARRAEDEASQFRKEALWGRALAAALQAEEGVPDARGGENGNAVATRHSLIAQSLFPDMAVPLQTSTSLRDS